MNEGVNEQGQSQLSFLLVCSQDQELITLEIVKPSSCLYPPFPHLSLLIVGTDELLSTPYMPGDGLLAGPRVKKDKDKCFAHVEPQA